MKLVATTQRISVATEVGERRDALDQRWSQFLAAAGLAPLPMPNHLPSALALWSSVPVEGLLLTGGDTLGGYGGTAHDRDACELELLSRALRAGTPVLGICRGMQLLLASTQVPLVRVTGHVSPQQWNVIEGVRRSVNSYHDWGTYDAPEPWEVWARSDDGLVKAVRQPSHHMAGIMWHPERLEPFAEEDIRFFRRHFGVD